MIINIICYAKFNYYISLFIIKLFVLLKSSRDMLGQRGIKPENLPASEDIKKLERRVKREEKKLAEQSGKLTNE